MQSKTILIYDDDPKICRLIVRALSLHEYSSQVVESAEELFNNVINPNIGLVILDLTLPDVDGLTIARQLKQKCSLPIIMVTGRGQVQDKLKGFDSGADDYLPKPFAIDELIARVRQLLKLYSKIYHREALDEHEIDLKFGIRLDVDGKKLLNESAKQQKLTGMEVTILKHLVEHRGAVVSRELLGRTLIGAHWQPSDRGIDVHIARIRKKCLALAPDHTLIESIRGVGYAIK